MAITMHFIDDEWKMQSVLVSFFRVMYPHTGERLAQHLLDGVTAMSPMLLTSIWAITADNASTNPVMVGALNGGMLQQRVASHVSELFFPSINAENPDQRRWRHNKTNAVFQIGCLAHILQLSIQAGLKACPILEVAIGRFRDIIKKIIDSPKLLEALSAICAALKVPARTPQLDVPTRWNSTWEMLDTATALRKALEELLRRIRERHEGFTAFSIKPTDDLAREIDRESWAALDDFCQFLRPFKDATSLMSGSSYPTLGLTIPVFHVIMEHVKDSISHIAGFHSSQGRIFGDVIRESLQSYEQVIRVDAVTIAAALDPRVKGLLPTIGIDSNHVLRMIETEFDLEYSDSYNDSRQAATSGQSADVRPPTAHENSFLSLLASSAPTTNIICGSDAEPFRSELDRWMAHAPMSLEQSSHDVCRWFQVNRSLYPRVQFMARDYLGVTATSVPSECVFSRAGTTVDKRRARLGDDSVQAICELQSFLAFNKGE
jgi:hypothetical protein